MEAPDAPSFTSILLGLIGLGGTVIGWSAKRHVHKYDEEQVEHRKALAEHSSRIHALETHVATRDDIEGVYSRLNKMADTTNEQHAKILELLLKRGK